MATNAALPLYDYGYALVHADGTVAFKSPNISVTAEGAGVYQIGLNQPVAPIAMVKVTGATFGAAGIDFSASVDSQPIAITTKDQLIVTTRVGGVATNEAFYIEIKTVGINAIASNP